MVSTEQNMKTYRGNCHCGAFVFEIDCAEIKAAVECNCSICFKKGYAWTFPGHENVKMIKGNDNTLTKYAFNEKTTNHCFCPLCGTPVMALSPDGSFGGKMALNVRCIQDINVWTLELQQYDGAALPPPYEPPVYTGPELEAEVEGGKTYHGSCHCGAVRFAVKIQPLDTYKGAILDCDCSICRRNGYIWIYHLRPQVVIQGEENLQYYAFKDAQWHKTFCKKCGVQISNERNDDLSPDVISAAREADREFYRQNQTPWRPINLRALNNLNKDVLKKLDIEKDGGWDGLEPQYVNP